ncbi:MAG: sigma-70 family RNA polymerase sigma factor [Gemmatimonadetes bacterium]|nr:sigma-70 family RNA polymerase sigma factor [Gemmatimonadota bacterium]
MSTSSPTPSDADLVALALRGDGDAADVLVRRYYRAAFAVALGVLGNRQDAEDVCQEAFVKALDRLEDCRDPSRFAPWMMTIARNRALSYHTYRRIRETSELRPEIAEAKDSPAEDATRAELGARLEAALAGLTAVQREVVLLHDMDGWTHGQIAEALQMTEVRSRQHLFVARKLLRERLGLPMLKEYTHE